MQLQAPITMLPVISEIGFVSARGRPGLDRLVCAYRFSFCLPRHRGVERAISRTQHRALMRAKHGIYDVLEW